MARKPLRRRKSRRRLGALIIGGLMVAAGTAYATYPVIDVSAIAKITEQLNAMSKDFANQVDQLAQLKQSVGFLNEVSGAIGKAANITVPITSSDNLAAQLRSNLRCLMPKGTSWGIDTDELDLGSICNSTQRYSRAFFVNYEPGSESGFGAIPGGYGSGGSGSGGSGSGGYGSGGSGSGGTAKLTFEEMDARRREVERRRQAFMADTTMRSLAMADVQHKQAEEVTKAADELKAAADAAVTEQDRLAVLLNIQVTLLRGQAHQTEILAQMLKLQTAMALNAGLTKEEIETGGEGEE